MDHCITHPFESTRCSRFYLAGALRNAESLLTPADNEQAILSLSSDRPEQISGKEPGTSQRTTEQVGSEKYAAPPYTVPGKRRNCSPFCFPPF